MTHDADSYSTGRTCKRCMRPSDVMWPASAGIGSRPANGCSPDRDTTLFVAVTLNELAQRHTGLEPDSVGWHGWLRLLESGQSSGRVADDGVSWAKVVPNQNNFHSAPAKRCLEASRQSHLQTKLLWRRLDESQTTPEMALRTCCRSSCDLAQPSPRYERA